MINTIHPSIRVSLFVLVAAVFSFASINGLVTGGILLVLFYLYLDPRYFKSAFTMFTRLRWLLISLVIIYFWFTPGESIALPFFENYAGWMPTEEGIAGGVERVLSLLMIILAVNLLLRTTNQEQLLSAIYWLAKPVSFIGISRDRLAVRMVMVMSTLSMVQNIVTGALSEIKTGSRADALKNTANVSSEVFSQVLERADRTSCNVVEVSLDSSPPLYQWLYPVVLALVLFKIVPGSG